jgi:hypothetical protein
LPDRLGIKSGRLPLDVPVLSIGFTWSLYSMASAQPRAEDRF